MMLDQNHHTDLACVHAYAQAATSQDNQAPLRPAEKKDEDREDESE